jgi:GH15 family glucan-1,4-alpha-glucosidase
MERAPRRVDGYAPIRDYAAIGNERCVALVALDASIDWLCLPAFDSPSVLGALLDPRAGGSFSLQPTAPFTSDRAYAEDTNVLQTTLHTTDGTVRITDAMTIPETGPLPWNELVRRIECLEGRVTLRYSFEPRFGWGAHAGSTERRQGVPAIVCGTDVITVHGFDTGDLEIGDGRVAGEFSLDAEQRALIGVGAFHEEPILLSERHEIERRLDETMEYWRRRAERVSYAGPWRDAVVRSALALQLLVHGATGAIVAAPTTSLPERVKGPRNFDYRFSWLRDTTFTLEAMLRLGYSDQVHASLGWLLAASVRTHPRLSVFYQLDGNPPRPQEQLGLAGYRQSQPVVTGNGAAGQLQLGNYGDLLQTAWLYVNDGNSLDPGSAMRLGEVADLVCEIWRNADASIWELGDTEQYTQGKIGAWLALERAARLADVGELPDDRAGRWRQEAERIRDFVTQRCWAARRAAYARIAGGDGLDASVLLGARRSVGFFSSSDPRLRTTVDAIDRELGRGQLVYRYSGMEDREGAFLACSFWMVEALSRLGRREEAHERMDELVQLGNDVGLYSEEMDPETGDMLGNFPQALTHLALVNAAYEVVEDSEAA